MTVTSPRILVTNDDGFDTPGIAVLIDAARTITSDIWVVAPHQDQSGVAQSISINNPLRAQPRGSQQWSVSGTPSDCVALAVAHFMKEQPPTLILSGVNAGENIGDDIHLSGTIGAAFTGLMLGIPAIAISLYRHQRHTTRWETAKTLLPDLLATLVREGWDKNHCLSINLPDLPPDQVTGLCWTRPARKTVPTFIIKKSEDLREKDYFWLYPSKNHMAADSGSDVAALQRGQISVSALTLERSTPVITAAFGKKTANDE